MNRTSHNLPFADYLAADGVSNSLLTKFRRCPLLAYEIQSGLIKDEPTDAMLIGKLTDAAIFEPENFDNTYYLQPETYEAGDEDKPWNNNAKVCKLWNQFHSDRPIITTKERDSVLRLVEAVWADQFASQLLRATQYQVSLFAKHDRTGLMRKGRPDAIGMGYLLDLKKVADASNAALSRAIASYGYYVQAAYYLDLCEALNIEANDFYFIAVEPGQRPKVNVKRLGLESIALGRWVYERDLAEYAKCKQSGIWPSYSGSEIGQIEVPHWEEEHVKGSLELIDLEG